MARAAKRVYRVGGRLQLVVLPAKRRGARRLRSFVVVHQKAIGVTIVVIVSVALVVVHQHQLAAVTFASVGEKVLELTGEILSDRLFPGGEFTKEV